MSAVHNYPIYATVEIMESFVDNMMQNLTKNYQRRETRQNSKINSISNDLQNAKKETNEKLNSMRKSYDKKLKKQTDDFTGKLKDFRKELKNDITIVQNSVITIDNQLKQKSKTDSDIAQKWIGIIEDQIQFIKGNYNWEIFEKSAVERLERDLNNAKTNYSNKQFEAAISSSQTIFSTSEQVEEEIILKTIEWENLFAIAGGKADTLGDFIDNNKEYRFEAKDMNGNDAYDDIDTDYWSQGEMSKNENKKDSILKKLDKEKNNLSIEDLSEIIKKLNTLTKKTVEDVKTAVVNFRISIDKQDVQEVIADKLGKLGYQIIDNVWEDDDERNKNVLIVENSEGERILITLDKHKNQDAIDFHWETNIKDKRTREERVKALTKTINEEINQKEVDLNSLNAEAGDRPVEENQLQAKRFQN